MSDWREQAACIGADPEMFFPGRNDWFLADSAKAVCRTCPVIEDCLTWALAIGVTDGVFGGMTSTERHRLKERVA